MTLEEKAQAYDRALEMARKRVAVEPQDHTDEILKDIFPELKESKDEKIRKALVSIVKGIGADSCYFTENAVSKNGVLAYLERQKEPKPINWTELNGKDIAKLDVLINTVHNEYPNGIGQESFGEEVLERFREYKGDENLDEKEQKPTNGTRNE